jgi:AAA ATPase domain
VEAVRAGESRALVVHGEPGDGKTALLDYLAADAPRCRIERAAGVESEMELAFAGLHQLCAPILDRLETVPVPQREALRTAFGMSAGPAADRFLVGLAVLSLMSAVAERQPLICLVDDGQWLDQASRTVLSFAARRLRAESVGLVIATRVADGELAGLPELMVRRLPGNPYAGSSSALAGRGHECLNPSHIYRGTSTSDVTRWRHRHPILRAP